MAAATKNEPSTALVVGSDAVVPVPGGTTTAPAGTVHAVEGWLPVCGGDRVRFVFPGRDPQKAQLTCPDCSAAVAAGGSSRTRAAS